MYAQVLRVLGARGLRHFVVGRLAADDIKRHDARARVDRRQPNVARWHRHGDRQRIPSELQSNGRWRGART